jgi:F-type H+-transporting ATPase subunit epsilon
MPAFHFELVSPEKLIFAGDVEAVTVPGLEGEFTVLKDHAPLMSTLKPGVILVEGAPGSKTKLFVRGGFADVAPHGLTILAEFAAPLEELNASQLDADIKAASDEVTAAHTDESRRLAAEKRDQLIELKTALRL